MLDYEDELQRNQPHYTLTQYRVTIHDPRGVKQTLEMREGGVKPHQEPRIWDYQQSFENACIIQAYQAGRPRIWVTRIWQMDGELQITLTDLQNWRYVGRIQFLMAMLEELARNKWAGSSCVIGRGAMDLDGGL